MSGFETQGLVFSLRNGETCAFSGDTLTVGQRQIPLNTVVSAGLVADISVPVPPGMPPTPGVSLSLIDGSTLAFTPVEQLDCWRLLHMLAVAQPKLSSPLPPPPGQTGPTMGYGGYGGPSYGYPPPTGFPPPMGYPPYPGGYAVSESDKTLAGICHLSFFFAPVILPLIIWLAMRNTQPYASSQAKQAFVFHLFFTVLSVGAYIGLQVFFISSVFSMNPQTPPDPTTFGAGFFLALFGVYGAIAILGIINLVFSIIGAIQGFQGRPFHYPLLGKMQ